MNKNREAALLAFKALLDGWELSSEAGLKRNQLKIGDKILYGPWKEPGKIDSIVETLATVTYSCMSGNGDVYDVTKTVPLTDLIAHAEIIKDEQDVHDFNEFGNVQDPDEIYPAPASGDERVRCPFVGNISKISDFKDGRCLECALGLSEHLSVSNSHGERGDSGGATLNPPGHPQVDDERDAIELAKANAVQSWDKKLIPVLQRGIMIGMKHARKGMMSAKSMMAVEGIEIFSREYVDSAVKVEQERCLSLLTQYREGDINLGQFIVFLKEKDEE